MRQHRKIPFARRLRKTMTRAEVLLWSKLRREALGWRFRRQHPIGPYVADFVCIETLLIVEVDGATHSTNEEIAADFARTQFLERQGWRVVRVWNDEVVRNMDGVLTLIGGALREQEGWLKRPS